MDIDQIPQSPGFFEAIFYRDGHLFIEGWMFLPEVQYDRIDLHLNGEHHESYDMVVREDVAAIHPTVPHAAQCGFRAHIPMTEEESRQLFEIVVVGTSGGEALANMATCFSGAVEFPNYPVELMHRVAVTDSNYFFKCLAFRTFYAFWKLTSKHTDPQGIETMLDWGCGCGKLFPVLQELTDVRKIYGADIDEEAIAWCGENFPGVQTEALSPHPPTPFAGGQFDLVYSFSVLTHLTREDQLDWLAEIRRILTPGGLFIATVHGEYAIKLIKPQFRHHITKACLADGISDETRDPILDGVAPSDYYRATYQTEDYTRRVYGESFEVLEYIAGGPMNTQDLVVLRKPSPL